jgi:hypothetical protein
MFVNPGMNPGMPRAPIDARNPGIGPARTMDPRMGFQQPGGPLLGSFKKGGKVKKTGKYKLHKGEKVISLKNVMNGEK